MINLNRKPINNTFLIHDQFDQDSLKNNEEKQNISLTNDRTIIIQHQISRIKPALIKELVDMDGEKNKCSKNIVKIKNINSWTNM